MSEHEDPRPDPEDGLPALPVGEWALEKHRLLKLYIEITRGARQRYIGPGKAGATYMDLFSASGRGFIRGTDRFIDGSPLVAWNASVSCGVPFSAVHVNDSDAELLEAANTRLLRLGAPVTKHGGEVRDVIEGIVHRLEPYGLHFALIDPYRLELPFLIIKALAKLKRIDLLIHVSAMDLQRNWGIYTTKQPTPLDEFAPGWRSHVNLSQPEESARVAFINYWVSLLKQLGFGDDVKFQLITGSNNQPLYWLVLIAKHEIALKFWKKATEHGGQRDMWSL